jgi:CBS domain-containing protein
MTTIGELMSATVHSARVDEAVDEVSHRMHDLGVHALPVVDRDDRLVGIVSTLDLADAPAGTASVEELMSSDVHSVHPETEMSMAALMMRRYRIHHLVVTDSDGRTVGLVSSWDLLEGLASMVRARTVDATDIGAVARGDELIVRRRPDDAPLRARIHDVRGPAGLPPYVVVWDDDPDQSPVLIDIERHGELSLDGCER